MGDRKRENQLISGFYPPEGSGWRWTTRKFTLALGPPRNAAQHGAKLVLQLYIPAGQIEKLGPLTLSAEAAGHALEPETFSKPGSYTYARELPPSIVDTNLVPLNFTLDKFTPPSAADGRELGVVVNSAALQPDQ